MMSKAPVNATEVHVKFAREYGIGIYTGMPLADAFDLIVEFNGHPQLRQIKSMTKRIAVHKAAEFPTYGRPWFEKYCYKRFKQFANRAQKKMERRVARHENRKAEVKQLWDFFYSIPEESIHVIGSLPASHFYQSKEWKRFRYMFIACFGARCMACGVTSEKSEAQIEVDHIYPRHLFPELAFRPDNLQTLCRSCHDGKGRNFPDACVSYSPLGKGV